MTLTNQKLHALSSSLDTQLRAVTPPGQTAYHARDNFADNSSENKHYFHKQIVAIAKRFDYFANFDNYRSWARMTLSTEQDFDYVISLHGYGPGDSGIMAASAFTYIKAVREDGGTEPVDLHPAATDLFQFNYAESYESTSARYAEWLESSLAIAMAEWKRTLQS